MKLAEAFFLLLLWSVFSTMETHILSELNGPKGAITFLKTTFRMLALTCALRAGHLIYTYRETL